MTCDSHECRQGRKPCPRTCNEPLPVEMLGPEPLPFLQWIRWLAVGWLIFSFVVGASLLAGYWSNTP